MKIIFITGSHPRHKFIARCVFETGHKGAIICDDRGTHVPAPPEGLDPDTEKLFIHHFAERETAEQRFFGDALWPQVPVHKVQPEKLNSPAIHELLQAEQPDLLLTYGCHKLTNETLACVKGQRWNCHGGLSPWYKGAVTHFWPSYMLEPQMTGMTVHNLTAELDAGAVVHQCTADLIRGDGVHALACRAVAKLGEELPVLLKKLADGEPIEKKQHTTSGKLWPGRDWRPEHLHLIYTVYKDRIVDHYLDGKFDHHTPKLHRQF